MTKSQKRKYFLAGNLTVCALILSDAAGTVCAAMGVQMSFEAAEWLVKKHGGARI